MSDPIAQHDRFAHRSWISKFATSMRGLKIGVAGQSGRTSSFLVHIPIATLVVAAGCLLGVSQIEFGVLLLCIGSVLVAELFNSSIEAMAKAVTREQNEQIRDCLDIASSAVLVASLFAAIVGLMVLMPHLVKLLG